MFKPLILGLLSGFALAGVTMAVEPGEEKVRIEVQEPWHAVFGGKEAVFHAAVFAAQDLDASLGWSLSAGGSAVQRGESPVSAGPGRSTVVEIRLHIPETKEGVVFPLVLSVSLAGKKESAASARCDRTLWAFGEDPFANRKEWLKKLNLRLFDPEEKTAEVFDKAGVPFQPINSVDALAGIDDGVLVIGEGVSWKDYRALAELGVKAADKGAAVLFLAPGRGEMSVPGMGEGESAPKPSEIVMKEAAVIGELDKRLDWKGWPPDGKMVSRSLKLKGERGPVTAAVEDGSGGWPWLELRFNGGHAAGKPHGGRLVICGFALVEKWDCGPVPRFLLAGILDSLAGQGSAKKNE